MAQSARPGKLAALPGGRSAVAGAVTMDKLTAYADASTYNNFYEFGTDKSDPARNAHTLKPRPWTVAVEGEVKKPGSFDLDERCSSWRRWKSASTACAASKAGRWSSPGWAGRWPS
jgi:sulfoxide reductase catalytic subunit YedY